MHEAREELSKTENAKSTLEEKLAAVAGSNRRREKEYGAREKELWNALQKAQDEHEHTVKSLETEKTNHVLKIPSSSPCAYSFSGCIQEQNQGTSEMH